jgi:hypothetical protein
MDWIRQSATGGTVDCRVPWRGIYPAMEGQGNYPIGCNNNNDFVYHPCLYPVFLKFFKELKWRNQE